jgi:hypothetical protein
VVLVATGGFDATVAGVHVSSRSPWPAMVLATVTGLGAWSASLFDAQRPGGPRSPHRGFGFVLLLTVLSAGLNTLTLKQPAPPPDEHHCLFDNPIGRHGFRHLVNCDSPTFLALAQSPSLVFVEPSRQSRPLSFGLPHLLAFPISRLPGVETMWPYRPYAAEFAAFLAINLTLLVAALWCFAITFERAIGGRGGPELLLVLVVLAVNDLTKLFLWTPHVQLYNLFVACLSLHLSFEMLRRNRSLTYGRSLVGGLALGLGLLAYGSFVLPLLCVATLQVLLHRRTGPALLMLAAAVAPYLTWVTFVWLRTGGFYNHETAEYRQFVWMIDCVRSGAMACAPVVTRNLLTFGQTAAGVLWPFLAAIGVLALVTRRKARSATSVSAGTRALRVAAWCSLLVTGSFLAAMGFYAPRLIWLLVPPLLLLVAVAAHDLLRVRSRTTWWGADAAAYLAALAYLALLVSRQGPYT